VTWNWSDQYDIKYQFAGVPFDADQVLVRGHPAEARFGVFHLKAGVIQAVEAVNAPAEFMGGKMLIGQKRPVNLARLADVSVSMKEVAA
jgi:3-phenylpropionate/trans-cinnamate dioxygenase ferredoxin reductase subunit